MKPALSCKFQLLEVPITIRIVRAAILTVGLIFLAGCGGSKTEPAVETDATAQAGVEKDTAVEKETPAGAPAIPSVAVDLSVSEKLVLDGALQDGTIDPETYRLAAKELAAPPKPAEEPAEPAKKKPDRPAPRRSPASELRSLLMHPGESAPIGNRKPRFTMGAAPMEGIPDPDYLPPVVVRVRADNEGRLAGIFLGQNRIPDVKQLCTRLGELVGSQRPPIFAIELTHDARLKFSDLTDVLAGLGGCFRGGTVQFRPNYRGWDWRRSPAIVHPPATIACTVNDAPPSDGTIIVVDVRITTTDDGSLPRTSSAIKPRPVVAPNPGRGFMSKMPTLFVSDPIPSTITPARPHPLTRMSWRGIYLERGIAMPVHK